MSTYAWAIRPHGPVSRGGGEGHAGLRTLLGVLRDLGEILAFSYRLRTAERAQPPRRAPNARISRLT